MERGRAIGLASATLLAVGCKSGGESAPQDASAPPPWLHDAGLVVRAPLQRPLRELCGLASNPSDLPVGSDVASAAHRANYFRAANDLGVSMVRRDFVWFEIEPSQGQYVWAPYDAFVAEASAAGVRVLAVPYKVPAWAAADPASKGDTSAPKNATDYAAFAGALATHFAGKVLAWEIWNEQSNGLRFWTPTLGGDPALYADVLASAHDAMRAADPTTPVIFGGCTFDPQIIPGAVEFESKVFEARADVAQKLEKMALHPYELYPPSVAPEKGDVVETPLEAKIQEQAWVLAQHGRDDAPLWLTEIGWPVASPVDEAAQARFLVRATILAARAGAEGIFWYTLRDGANPEKFPPEDAFGLLHNDAQLDAGKDGTPKRAYAALKTLLTTVGARWPSADAPKVSGLPDDGFAVSFSGSDAGRVVALWTVASSATVTLSDLHGNVLDAIGASRGSSDPGVDVGPDPVYVVGP